MLGAVLSAALAPAARAQAGKGAPIVNIDQELRLRGLPPFFEVTRETEEWVDQAMKSAGADPDEYKRSPIRSTLRYITYPEADPVTNTVKRYFILGPEIRGYASNGPGGVDSTAALGGNFFDFGVKGREAGEPGAKTFGHFIVSQNGKDVPGDIISQTPVSGSNVTSVQRVGTLQGSGLSILENKGFSGSNEPIAFDSWILFDGKTPASEDPRPAAGAAVRLQLGMVPVEGNTWHEARVFEAAGYRVLVADGYFLAAPAATAKSWYFGNVSKDLVVEPGLPASKETSASNVRAAALFLDKAHEGLVFSGRSTGRSPDEVKAEVEGLIRKASRVVTAYDRAMKDLHARGDGSRQFGAFMVPQVLAAHKGLLDPRGVQDAPIAADQKDAPAFSRNLWHGRDNAGMLSAVSTYYRATGDASVLPSLRGIADFTLDGQTPSGGVWARKFDQMLYGVEFAENAGRWDVFIENGGVSLCFNHERVILQRGHEHDPAATWGALDMDLGSGPEAVDAGRFRFRVAPDGLPREFRTNQPSLSVTRNFDHVDASGRVDDFLSVDEIASVARGVPAGEVSYRLRNTGKTPRAISSVGVNFVDKLNYGNGTNERSQSYFGLSPKLGPISFYMEGSDDIHLGEQYGFRFLVGMTADEYTAWRAKARDLQKAGEALIQRAKSAAGADAVRMKEQGEELQRQGQNPALMDARARRIEFTKALTEASYHALTRNGKAVYLVGLTEEAFQVWPGASTASAVDLRDQKYKDKFARVATVDFQVDMTEEWKDRGYPTLVFYGYSHGVAYRPRRKDGWLLLRNTNSPSIPKTATAVSRAPASATPVEGRLAPGATLEIPAVDAYPFFVPLTNSNRAFADGSAVLLERTGRANAVPDELEYLVPLWSQLVDAVKDATGYDDALKRLDAMGDKGRQLRRLMNTSLETDLDYSAMANGWIEAQALFSRLAGAGDAKSRRDAAQLAGRLRTAALRGAAFALDKWDQLRNRPDLMPAYGATHDYGYQVPVFAWASREMAAEFKRTDDRRYQDASSAYRDAAVQVADGIVKLQVKDPSKPNLGGFLINESAEAAGDDNLDDQGVKLWALRCAYDLTGDARYRESAKLFLEKWLIVSQPSSSTNGLRTRATSAARAR